MLTGNKIPRVSIGSIVSAINHDNRKNIDQPMQCKTACIAIPYLWFWMRRIDSRFISGTN